MTGIAGPTVLVVDDELAIRALLQDLLEGEGYRVLVATEGSAALAAAQEELPDLVLSDLMMPNLDGRALAAQLHANPQTTHIPVMLMSAAYHPQVDDAFAAVIHKPFDLDVLVETIHPYLP